MQNSTFNIYFSLLHIQLNITFSLVKFGLFQHIIFMHWAESSGHFYALNKFFGWVLLVKKPNAYAHCYRMLWKTPKLCTKQEFSTSSAAIKYYNLLSTNYSQYFLLNNVIAKSTHIKTLLILFSSMCNLSFI